MTPAVSICVPTFNRAESLRSTIDALLAQSFQDFEIIVGDDASSDNTSEVIREFSDPRIRYLRHATNLGIYPNWNALLAEARGRYISIYHDHDTYLPTIVERSVDLLRSNGDMAFVHTAIVLIDKTGSPVDIFSDEFDEVTPGEVLRRKFSQTTRNTLCAATTMVRRDAYATAGPFDQRYGLPADRQMWFRLAALGTVGYVTEPQALILGRSRGDPTERFALRDLLGNYRISDDALGELSEPDSVERWLIQGRLRREVKRDLVAAFTKAIVFGGPSEVAERLAVVGAALGTPGAQVARMFTWWPLRPLLRQAAGAIYSRRLMERRQRALSYCLASPSIRKYLPPSDALSASHADG